MNTHDKIMTALTPGSIFNRNGLVFRSIGNLAQFAGMGEDELLELLNGDMAALVTCKPSTKGKGILVALTENIPTEDPNEPVQITAAPTAPSLEPVAETEVEEAEEVGEVAEAPLIEAAEA